MPYFSYLRTYFPQVFVFKNLLGRLLKSITHEADATTRARGRMIKNNK